MYPYISVIYELLRKFKIQSSKQVQETQVSVWGNKYEPFIKIAVANSIIVFILR